MGYDIIIKGFHGTTEDAAREILKTKKFETKYSEFHWLGQGIYFFREDVDQANTWALQITKKENRLQKKKMKACVLKTDVKVNSEQYLNLNSRSGLFKLNRMMSSIEKSLIKLGYSLNGKDPFVLKEKYLCAIMDLIPIEIIKVVQNNFSLNPPAFLNHKILTTIGLEMHSIQVCVRDESLIDFDSIVLHKESRLGGSFKRGKRRSNIINYRWKE